MELPLALVILCMVVPGIIYSQDDGCVTYDATPYSSFNTWNLFVLYPKKNPDMMITNVEVVRRGFYRCKMTQSGVEIVFYGHNGTHYWVEKGCSGDFKITECPEHKFNMAATLDSGDGLATSLSSNPGGFEGISASNLFHAFGSTLDKLKNQWQHVSLS